MLQVLANHTIRESLVRHSKDVFATMLGLAVTERSNADPTGSSSQEQEQVVALIGFGGDYVGNGMISCSEKLACQLASGMMMSQFSSINCEVMDAVGEIANMIFGNVKTEIEEHLGPLRLSIPTVIYGRSFKIRSTSNPAWITVPVRTGDQDFEVCVCISQRSIGGTITQPRQQGSLEFNLA